MKDSTNQKIAFDTSRFMTLPTAFMLFTDEEKENWCKEEKQNNINCEKAGKKSLVRYTGDGIIIPANQIPNLDVNFADIYNKYFEGRTVLIDIFTGDSFKTEDFAKIIEFSEKLKEKNNDLMFNESSAVYTLDEVYVSNLKINSWVEEINSKTIDGKPLSPLEKFYLAYDIVTNFEYQESEFGFESRNLVSLLQGNKIVCVGYAKLLSQICKHLGIECETQLIADRSNTPNHMNCVVRIKDEKYGVDGVFYSDPCWDSIKNGQKSISNMLLDYREIPIFYGDRLKIKKNENAMDYLVIDSKLKDIKTREEWQKVITDFIKSGKDEFLKFIDTLEIDENSLKDNPSTEELNEIIDFYITGVYSMKKMAQKYANDKSIYNSLTGIDAIHKHLIERLVNAYTTKDNFNEFKEKIGNALEAYCPEITSKSFDEMRKIYEFSDKEKNEKLLEQMKKNSKGLEFNKFIRLTNNLAKLDQPTEGMTKEGIRTVIRNSIAKSFGHWKNAGNGINPISKLCSVAINRKSVYPKPIASYVEDFYDSLFNSKPKKNDLTENEMNLLRAIFGQSQPGE